MVKYRISAVVLAGGGSKRMGRNKALLKIGDKRMIQMVVEVLQGLFDEVLLVTRNPSTFYMLDDVKFVMDAIDTRKKNSLIGLYSGLLEARNEFIFIVPCDMPFLNIKLIKHMVETLDGEDVRVPMVGPHFQPLHGLYRKTCLPYIKNQLDEENYKIIDFYDHVLVRPVCETEIRRIDPGLNGFVNINTQSDYEQAKAKWLLDRSMQVNKTNKGKRSEKQNETRRSNDILQ